MPVATGLDESGVEADIVVPIEDEVASTSRLGAYFTVLFAGFALLSDGYQNGIVSFVNSVFSRMYPDHYTDAVSTRISNAALAGQIVGQLGFGLIVDRIGRKTGLVACTILVVIGAGLTAASQGPRGDVGGLFWMMTIMRGVLGVGVGGEYPCSSASASEAADLVKQGKRGGIFVLVTNVVIDVGFVLSAVVPAILLMIFGWNEGANLQVVWRLALGFGMLPPLSVLYFRIKSLNVERYSKNHMKHSVPYILILKKYWPRLLVTSGIWFFYDFIAYPAGIFWSVIISTAVPDPSNLFKIQCWGILLNFFYLPGAFLGAVAVDKIGRRKTMALGFVGIFLFGVSIVLLYESLVAHALPVFVLLYGLYLSSGEFGPGDCIGLTAAESYPTAIRGTAYGISAAVGKIGAFIGTQAFRPLTRAFEPGSPEAQKIPFLVGAIAALIGAIISYMFLPEYNGRSLEIEDAEFRAYLVENGIQVDALVGDRAIADEIDREERVGLLT
ncbi:hypothetical protein SpCBS45565_g05168 [Spizellomyces sp. 'palustris']|nr:hypothetical protein SpCBS45565_g05168 [Spizellomyces sp. 'palustris']